DTMRGYQLGNTACTGYLTWVSPIFFTTFVIIVQFVLVNLVVAAIMQAPEDSTKCLSCLIPLSLSFLRPVHQLALDIQLITSYPSDGSAKPGYWKAVIYLPLMRPASDGLELHVQHIHIIQRAARVELRLKSNYTLLHKS
ncbi:hypothetical protein GOODEAATRI_021475, partial [Goodea atripinnis]